MNKIILRKLKGEQDNNIEPNRNTSQDKWTDYKEEQHNLTE